VNNTIFKELSSYQKLFAYLLLLFCCSILATFIGIEIMEVLINKDFTIINSNQGLDNNSIRGLKIITFFSHLGTFIIPSVIFLLYFNHSIEEFWKVKKKAIFSFIAIPVFFLGTSILSEWTLLLNHQIDFSLFSKSIASYIDESQKNSELMITRFVGITWLSFLGNTLVIAIIPAIGEELTFRAVLQPLFINASKKKHFSILFVAFIFAFIHFQFMDFIPRFFLGVIYGYIFYFTKNIYYTIALHFLNNFIALTLFFSNTKYNLEIGSIFTQYSITLIIGIFLTWLGFKILWNKKRANTIKY